MGKYNKMVHVLWTPHALLNSKNMQRSCKKTCKYVNKQRIKQVDSDISLKQSHAASMMGNKNKNWCQI